MENLYVFCDESGNTGINIIDLQQPILVVGGWIVPVTRLNEANKLVKKVNIFSNELHGIDLLKGRASGARRQRGDRDRSEGMGCILSN